MSEGTSDVLERGDQTTVISPSRKAESPVRRASSRLLWAGVGLTVGGAGIVGWSVVGLPGGGWAQLGAVLVGFVLLFLGLSRLGQVRFDPGFDLTVWLCLVWLVVLIGAAVAAPWLPLGEHADVANTMLNPSMARPDLLSQYPLGTNNFGLDLLSRVVYGARVSLVVSVAAVLIGIAVGGSIGIAAGYFRGMTERVVGILTNSLLAVPPLILLITLATALEPTITNIAFGLSLLALPSMIRMARASTISFAQREFVLASKAMGASSLRVMARELMPNVLLPLASYGMVIVSVLIVAEASLSFLGLGIQPPAPSWGNMIAEGEARVFEDHPHVVLVPGVALFLTVFAFNALGERARKKFDPRQAKV